MQKFEEFVILFAVGFIGFALCAENVTTTQCGPNQAISPCYGPCTARTCANLNPRPNPRVDCPFICVAGQCDCKEGYRSLASGECVPEWQCPNWCNTPNEVKYDCYKECAPRTCPNVTQLNDSTCSDATPCEVGKCDCINGYLRNACGVCVPQAQCANACQCKANEKSYCINSCTARTCKHALSNELRKCATYCSKTCECIKNYARDDNGDCVRIAECCP